MSKISKEEALDRALRGLEYDTVKWKNKQHAKIIQRHNFKYNSSLFEQIKIVVAYSLKIIIGIIFAGLLIGAWLFGG